MPPPKKEVIFLISIAYLELASLSSGVTETSQ